MTILKLADDIPTQTVFPLGKPFDLPLTEEQKKVLRLPETFDAESRFYICLAALTVNGTAYTLPVDVDRDAGDRFGPGTAVYVNPPSALPDELDAFPERIDEALTAHYAEAA